MKGLKFRVWEEREKEYDTWSYILDDSGNLFRNAYGALIECDKKDYIIEQYTGLKDKNGKKIYEGDIVRYAIRPSRTTVVEWWSGEEEYYPCCTTSGFSLPYSEDGYEVIGNVHEDHELLEREDAGN